MENIILFVYELFYIVLMSYGVYFAIISAASFLRKKSYTDTDKRLRFAVVVAARNEQRCISGIIESIKKQNYPDDLIDIYVVPNNCTDDTELVAKRNGAEIIEVSSSVKSKGAALKEAFRYLLENENHDAYCVFDADNEADKDFIFNMNKVLCSGARVAKSRIFAKNRYDSWVSTCYDIHFCNANFLINRARENIGLSSRLIGTGFALKRDVLVEKGGWNTETLTEDAEIYASLCAEGERIAFAGDAVTYDEEPITFFESIVQRRRWMSGIMDVAFIKSRVLVDGVANGRGGMIALDAFLQLSFSVIQAFIIPMFILWLSVDIYGGLSAVLPAALRFYIASLAVGAISLAAEDRLDKRTFKGFVMYPVFVFSFLVLQTFSIMVPNKKWKPMIHRGMRIYESGR